MKTVVMFVRTTVLGGLLFLVPFVIATALAAKAVSWVRQAMQPLIAKLPSEALAAPLRSTLAAALIVVAICFLGGLLARTLVARKSAGWLEEKVLSSVPGYEFVKQAGASILHIGEMSNRPVVLAPFGDSWRLGIQTDVLASGHVVVFIPNSPRPFSGSVFFFEEGKIRPTGLPLATALNILQRSGAGAREVLSIPRDGSAKPSPKSDSAPARA